MNDLRHYFENNKGRVINKWSNYFEIYERHFSRFRNTEVALLEIGVFQGGSLQMWKNYLGSSAKIYGIDIDPRCKAFEEKNIEIFIGSQSDKQFLSKIKKKIPRIDILIDDGGHTMGQMETSFLELFDHVKDDGIYLVEDLHTGYWPGYGGGYKRRGSFNEISKSLIDSIQAWHSRQSCFKIDKYTKTIHSVHCYDGIVVIEKRLIDKPVSLVSGVLVGDPFAPVKRGLYQKYKSKMITALNIVLAYFRIRSIPRI